MACGANLSYQSISVLLGFPVNIAQMNCNTKVDMSRVGVGIMSQLSIVALFLEMDYLRILKIAPDIK